MFLSVLLLILYCLICGLIVFCTYKLSKVYEFLRALANYIPQEVNKK